MRASTTTTLLLPALASAAYHPVSNNERRIHIADPAAIPQLSSPTPTLGPREVVVAPAAAAATVFTQYPSITTQWVETVTNGVHTWVEIIYTQKFAEVPSQAPAPGAGEIGLGTLKGEVGVVQTSIPQRGEAARVGQDGWRTWAVLATVVLGGMGIGGGLVVL